MTGREEGVLWTRGREQMEHWDVTCNSEPRRLFGLVCQHRATFLLTYWQLPSLSTADVI
jgi:hypothetical protein